MLRGEARSVHHVYHLAGVIRINPAFLPVLQRFILHYMLRILGAG